MGTSNSLKRAKKMFATKIGMLTNVVAANAKRAERDLTALTGVVHNIAKANAADRSLIRAQTAAMEADLNKAVTRAIQIGDMLMTVGALAAVKAPKAEGLGFGGKVLP